MENNWQTIAHSGFSSTNANFDTLFSHDTASFLSRKITELLRPFYPPGITVPLDKISNVLNAVYEAYRPSTGDIYSRYTIPSNENPNCIDEILNQTIQIIVSQIKDTLIMEQTNENLSIWTTVLGDFNKHGLQSHAPIKIRNRKPQSMQFNMNY